MRMCLPLRGRVKSPPSSRRATGTACCSWSGWVMGSKRRDGFREGVGAVGGEFDLVVPVGPDAHGVDFECAGDEVGLPSASLRLFPGRRGGRVGRLCVVRGIGRGRVGVGLVLGGWVVGIRLVCRRGSSGGGSRCGASGCVGGCRGMCRRFRGGWLTRWWRRRGRAGGGCGGGVGCPQPVGGPGGGEGGGGAGVAFDGEGEVEQEPAGQLEEAEQDEPGEADVEDGAADVGRSHAASDRYRDLVVARLAHQDAVSPVT
jgi:hypothetical protein